MKKQEAYPFAFSRNFTRFFFESHGNNFEDGREELFDPRKYYDGFLIERKKVLLKK